MEQVCCAHDYDDPGKPQIAWDDQEARAVMVDALVRDALALLEVLSGWNLEGPAAEVVALLALIAGQDVEPVEGSDGTDGRWRIAHRVAKGGFNRSSQHLDRGGVNGTILGMGHDGDRQGSDAFAGASAAAA